MPRTWSRAGRVVLIEDISRSDRPRLAPHRPPAPLPPLWLLLPLCMAWAALVGLIAIVARVWG
jgi:hypothetical protein